MCLDHESLIKVILEDEEELIATHRNHIDNVVDIVKKDMALLQLIDQPSSDVETYVKQLDAILIQKVEMIGKVREKLVKFY